MIHMVILTLVLFLSEQRGTQRLILALLLEEAEQKHQCHLMPASEQDFSLSLEARSSQVLPRPDTPADSETVSQPAAGHHGQCSIGGHHWETLHAKDFKEHFQ